MRLISIPDDHALLVDILVWIIIHLSIGFGSSRIPIAWFNVQQFLYRSYKWEQGGKIYQRLFRVHSWKSLLPNGGALYPNTFSIRRLNTYTIEYLERWLQESCRAEFCHWMMILPGFLFFFWNNILLGWWMVFYAVLNNLFPIIVQRYNRPRMHHLLNQMRRKSPTKVIISEKCEKEKIYSHSYS